MATPQSSEMTAPYASWSMFESTLERMRLESIPAKLDRSFLHSASGSARAQLTGALKAFGLIDDELRPTETLARLAREPDQRPQIMRELATTFYAPILQLESNATQDQLEAAFRAEYGIQGSTVKKAVSFFLQVAKVAGIEVSPLFQTTRTPSGTTRRKRTGRSKAPDKPAVPADSFADLRTKYVEALLKKFEDSNGEVDEELANRIERLMGFGDKKDPA